MYHAQCSCGECNGNYIGKTIRHIQDRMAKHIIIGKTHKTFSFGDHCWITGHNPLLSSYSILNSASSITTPTRKESLHISKHQLEKNNSLPFTQFYLFDLQNESCTLQLGYYLNACFSTTLYIYIALVALFTICLVKPLHIGFYKRLYKNISKHPFLLTRTRDKNMKCNICK